MNIPSTAIAQAAITNGVPVADITVIPNRMRRLRPDVVDELAESIAAQGLPHPITLREYVNDGGYAGEQAGALAAVGRLLEAHGPNWFDFSAAITGPAPAAPLPPVTK